MNNYNILIVEDEFFASQYLLSILEDFGYKNIYEATTCIEAKQIVSLYKIDLVFMDINIKGAIDGIECAKIINKYYPVPIVYTTAYFDSQTIKETTETNIYGYIIKPFNISNVESTLSIVNKKIEQNIYEETRKEDSKNIINLGSDIEFRMISNTLLINNCPIKLSKKELELLKLFIKNINLNISYETIQNIIWNEKDISSSTLRDTVSRLKKKVPGLCIENITSYGYILSL